MSVQHEPEHGRYSLVGDVDGAQIVFASVDAATVEAIVADAKAAADAGTDSAGGAEGTDGAAGGGGFSAADFRDNGDGTFTRESDGVTGRFTPSGFEPSSPA